MRVEELWDVIVDALEVDKRSSCRALHMTSGRAKKGKSKWIMVASRAPILEGMKMREQCTRDISKKEHALTLRLASRSDAAAMYARF